MNKVNNKKAGKKKLSELQQEQANCKLKTGPKPGKHIPGITAGRWPLEKSFLILFFNGDMGVGQKYGTATLCRYLTGLQIFKAANGKPMSYNTIKEDITEIKKELLHKESEKKPPKNNKKELQ